MNYVFAKILLLLLAIVASLYLRAQTAVRITLVEKGSGLLQVLHDIGRQSGYEYGATTAAVEAAGRLSFSVREMPLRELLDSVVQGRRLYYGFVGRSIQVGVAGLLSGRVLDERGQPVASATVTAVGRYAAISVSADSLGRYQVRLPGQEVQLLVSCVGYDRREVRWKSETFLSVQLQSHAGELKDIVVSNGFEETSAQRVTGSYDLVPGADVQRRVSPDLVARLEGVTSGMLVNTNIIAGTNQSTITIRGRSTIFSNPDPLIVVDNFPYSGDLNNINPQDVESVTVLKDAAAASLWGTRAANGVIVIKTRQGSYRQPPRLTLVSSLTVGYKPNLHYTPILSSTDYIGVEEYLFHQGFYQSMITSPDHPALSPVVEILLREQQGQLTAADTAAQLGALRHRDTRQDLARYWYRPSVNQQYWLGLTGGTTDNRYSLSGGLDQDLAALVRNSYSRITATGSNTYLLLPRRLELSTSLAFAASTTTDDNTGGIPVPYPYLQLADAQGNALAVPYQLRLGYADTAGGGRLLDWHYRPLDELRAADNVTKLTDWRLNLGLHYTAGGWGKGLEMLALYQYGQGTSDQQVLQSVQTYYTRNLVNEFTQIDPVTGQVSYGIPVGGIFNETINSYVSNNGRLQLSYHRLFGDDHDLHFLAGTEIQSVASRSVLSQLYGYDPATGTSEPVGSYSIYYPKYSEPGVTAQVPYLASNTTGADHYWSYYSQAAYQYRQRLTFSLSGRVDQSNLFGVDINHKTIPLWSAGVAWELSRQDFYHWDRLPFLRLRLTDGYNGNVYKSVSGFTTLNNFLPNAATIFPGFINTYGSSYAAVTNPPNPGLRWEQVQVINTGLDFRTRDSCLGGSLDYYTKTGRYLIGSASLDPTTGNTAYTANVADMIAHGADLVLHTKMTWGPVRWTTDLLFSYVRDRVTRYLVRPTTIQTFFDPASLNPLVGKPLYSVYALRWAGLDPQTGNPMGWLNGHTSEDYTNLIGSADFSTLVYKGPVNPPFFGSWRPAFSIGRWGLSALFVYKFGDYFTRPSIQYLTLFNGTSQGHPDFDKRWQQPGDERHTDVPSMTYPASSTRDYFYAVSEVLVEKGDLLRWQDLQLYYDWPKKELGGLPVQGLRLSVYANNLGLLWTANRQHIDPDVQNSLPVPRSIALQLKMLF